MAQTKRKKKRRASSSNTKAPIPIVEVIAPTTTRRGVGGAPTRYDPKYCDMVIERAKNGKSFESFGSEVHCHRDTLYEWIKVHPEFSDAKKIAEQYLLDFYEEATRNAAVGIVPAPLPGSNVIVTRPNGRLLELCLKIHGKQAGFQQDGTNKGMGGGFGLFNPKDTTVNFNYLDGPPPEKDDEADG